MDKSAVRILVVDDDRTLRLLNCLTLNALGYKCLQEAEDGAEALSLLQENEFNIVISDIMMPRLDGFGLLKTMCTFGYLTNTSVIMLTGESRAEDKQHAASLGASAYLIKPVNRAELQAALQRILGE